MAEGDFFNSTKLPCCAYVEKGLKYRRVSWYKMKDGAEGLTGLVLKYLDTNKTFLYESVQHEYQVGEDFSLMLPCSALHEYGKYQCRLWPPLGHQIQEGESHFNPASSGCIEATRPLLEESRLSRRRASSQWDAAMMGGLAAVLLLSTVSAAAAMSNSKCKKGDPYKMLNM